MFRSSSERFRDVDQLSPEQDPPAPKDDPDDDTEEVHQEELAEMEKIKK